MTDFPDTELPPTSPFYNAVITTAHAMPGVLVEHVGITAYQQLPEADRPRALLSAMGAYVCQVLAEHEHRQADLEARAVTSYLETDDVAVLTDLVDTVRDLLTAGIEPYIEVPAQRLDHVLAELDLVKHRLAMRQQDGAAR